jgi:hypothetical protein
MPRQYTPRVGLICQVCCSPFEVNAARIGTARFCSRRCTVVAGRQTMESGLAVRTRRTDTCWLIPSRWPDAYPNIGYYDGTGTSRYTSAHIAAWIIASGAPVPCGRYVCHGCDVKNCVRNDEPGIYVVNGSEYPRWGHLFLGDPRANMLDRSEKGRARTATGVDCHMSKLNDGVVREIRARYAAGGISQRRLAREYSIKGSTLHAIVHRLTWAHVE